MPIKILETAHPIAVSKSGDYFRSQLKELYQQKDTFISRYQYQANLC